MSSTVVLVVVSVLDLIAFGLAIGAEHRRASATIGKDTSTNYCVYDSNTATGLGVGAFIFLLASQVIIMVVSRCLCCGRALRPGSSRGRTIALFITCWVTFLIAEICLLAGSVRNAHHTKETTSISENPPSCSTSSKGLFGAGAAFVVFTGIASGTYYLSYSKVDDAGLPSSRDAGIAMGSYY
ncbi:hypothetical protein Leryth_000014 [Lithospermum erythrorhizon]|nr:hypothetical protein Leryth_000014 [Lithospermum erythrorhizon]